VLIAGKRAARVFDTTTHGGFIATGEESVLIGEYAGMAAVHVWPGQQSFGNCGVQCCNQVIQQATGIKYSEIQALTFSINMNWATPDKFRPELNGSTTITSMQSMLGHFNIKSTIYNTSSIITGSLAFRKKLTKALRKNRGVIIALNANTLWYPTSNNHCYTPHAVLITEGEFDEQGSLTHVYINDTGNGEQGSRVTLALLLQAMMALIDPTTGRLATNFLITNRRLWNRFTPLPSVQTP